MKNSTLIAIAALAACTTTVNAQQLRHTRFTLCCTICHKGKQ